MTLLSSVKTTHFHPPSVQSSCFLAQLNLAARCPELNLSFPTFFWSGCRLLSIYCELVEHSQRCSCTSAEVGCETLLKSSPGKKPFSSGSFFCVSSPLQIVWPNFPSPGTDFRNSKTHEACWPQPVAKGPVQVKPRPWWTIFNLNSDEPKVFQ